MREKIAEGYTRSMVQVTAFSNAGHKNNRRSHCVCRHR